MYDYFAASRKGERRDRNCDFAYIDNCVLSDKTTEGKRTGDNMVAVVCDGVGSTKGGGYAAGIVAESFKNAEDLIWNEKKLIEHIYDVHSRITELRTIMPDCPNMATTVAGIILNQNRYIVFNAGDTRVYRCSKNRVEQISVDHIAYIEKEQTDGKPRPAALTRYLGGNIYSPMPYIAHGSFRSDEIFILCSDGIYKELSEEIPIRSIAESADPIDTLRALLQNTQNGPDDNTVIVIKPGPCEE